MAQQLSQAGVLEQIEGGYRLRFERRLRHPIEKVWAAVSEPERLREWLAAATELDPHAGGAIELHWQNTDLEGNHAVARGHITEFSPPTTIAYDTDIHGLIRWELEPQGDGCLLRLTVSHDLPEEYLAIVMAGWHVHIDFLEDALDGQAVDWPNWPMDRWEVHHKGYEARFG
jgi:uncharacterized protein YndB with AHSA1/START domain